MLEVQINAAGNKIFAPLKGKELVLTPEERVRQEFIGRLVNHYGYTLIQMSQEETVNNSKRGQGKARADLVIWKSEAEKQAGASPVIVVECKAEHITVREEDYYQGANYAAWAGADFFVTTNIKETKVFRVVKGLMPKQLEEIVELPRAADFSNNKKIQELLAKTKAFTRDEFSKLLLKCHNIIRNNDKLSPEAAFDEISKILFMKIRYERDPNEHTIFTLEVFREQEANYEKNIRPSLKNTPKDLPYMDLWFERTKEEFANDRIFDKHEKIRIKQGSFEAIVKELEKYNLSDTSDDVKGIAFEEFLGRTFRGELGQFFTPRTVVDYMVSVLDPQEGETICDPCCGSGGFLIKAFEYVRSKIEGEIQKAKEELKTTYYTDDFDALPAKQQAETETKINTLFSRLNEELNLQNEFSRIRKLSYDCIFGTDANPRMARTAKMNMIMHGDGHGGVHHHDGLLNVNGIFGGRFDVILTNPPFGSRVERSLRVTALDLPSDEDIARYSERYPDYEQEAVSQIKNHVTKPVLDLFKVGEMSGLTEVLFIERSLNLLRPGGRLGIVLPEGVLNNPILQRVREWVEGKAKIINITSIPQDVFLKSGATVKPSLLFLKKFTEAEYEQYSNIKQQATAVATDKYAPQFAVLQDAWTAESLVLESAGDKDGVKAGKKQYKATTKALEAQRDDEIKAAVKTAFDYAIPIVEVEKAGISSTGAVIENELVTVAEEFEAYRKEAGLWKAKYESISYPVDEKGNIMRVGFAGVQEPMIFYKKGQ